MATEGRRVESETGRQRGELDGPDADVEAEDAEQAGREQVMRAALAGARGQQRTCEQRT
jgi:hypothetical protein